MKRIGIILVASLLLSGCASSIQLTPKESNLISEYAAYVLLKHDKHYKNMYLTDESSLENAVSEEESHESEEQASSETSEKATAQGTNTSQSTQGDVKEESSQSDPKQKPAVETLETADLASVFGLKDFTIVYNDYEIMDTYPNQEQLTETNQFYTVKPMDKDHKLLVLKFKVTNTTSNTLTCDIASLKPQLAIQIDNSSNIPILSSLSMHDLNTYVEEIPAGGGEEAVLILEISNSITTDSLKNITLQLVKDGNTKLIPLK